MRPTCRCHDTPMTRCNDTSTGWRCSVAHREAVRKWKLANPRKVERHRTTAEVKNRTARIAVKRELIAELEESLAGILAKLSEAA